MSIIEALLPYAKHILVMVLSGACVSALIHFAARSRPAARRIDLWQGRGRIRPSRPVMGLCTLLGLGIGGAALYGAVRALDPACACESGRWQLPAILGVAFTLLGLYCTLSLTSGWDVLWDEDGVEGATSVLPPPFGPRRIRMAWDEIAGIGGNSNGWYLVTPDGRRMCWNYFYAGYPTFMMAVEDRRPDLFPDETAPQPDHA